MIERKLIKVDRPDHPDRCQSNIRTGQCPFVKEPESDYCLIHQGTPNKSGTTSKEFRNYRLAQWQQRVNEFADHSQLKSMNEELGISRLVLESIMNRCHSDYDILLYSSKISHCVGDIERIIVSLHKLEFSTGLLINKNNIVQIAQTFVGIISQYIENPDILEEINNKFMDAVLSSTAFGDKEGKTAIMPRL